MHKLAERTILSGLVELGCLKGDVEEMLEKRIGFIFMPHGLGHYIGLDVHDAGSMARPLEPNMVITVEPGIYIPGLGGVRHEDVALIRENGVKLLTQIPKPFEI